MLQKYNLEQFTFIFHIRIDTEERLKNIETIIRFYGKTTEKAKFIFIEDDKVSTFYNHIVQTDALEGLNNLWEYYCTDNEKEWNKCAAFNLGIKESKTDYLIFHDVDAIIDPQQFVDSLTYFEEYSKCGILYAYNGEFLCVVPRIKEEFIQSLDIATLQKYYPTTKKINQFDGNVLVGHTNSVGGCVVGRKSAVLDINGYNPNFKGWGFEDNEFPKRMHILGHHVMRLQGNNRPLWHLPHEGPGQSLKAENPYYTANGELCKWVETQNKPTLEKYIKTWTI